MRNSLYALLGSFIAAAPCAMSAAVITFAGGGTLRYHNGAFQDVPFTTTFAYDTSSAPSTSFPESGQSQYVGISLSITVNLVEGTWSHTVANPYVSVIDGQYGDSFQVTSPGEVLNPSAPNWLYDSVPFSLNVELSGASTVFSSSLLPENIDLAEWSGTKQAKIYASLPSLPFYSTSLPLSYLSVIPEPATGGMIFAAAALGFAASRRRHVR
jgi:hypothetical protein